MLLPGGCLRDIDRRLFTPGRHRNHRRRRSCFRRIGIGGNRKLTLPRSDLAPALRRLGFPRRLIGDDLYSKGLRRRGRKGNRSLGTDRQSRLIRSRIVLLASRQQQHRRRQNGCDKFEFHTYLLLSECDFCGHPTKISSITAVSLHVKQRYSNSAEFKINRWK